VRRGLGRRERSTRAPGAIVLIACEGKTERDYFEGIRKDLHLPTRRVRIIDPPATDPLSIVVAALDARREAERERGWDAATDQAWAVFDVDDDLRDHPGAWNTAIQRAEGRVRVAVSCPAFELWCLLHFQDRRGPMTRQQTLRSLCDCWADYRKGAADYATLKPRTPEAIRRAEELMAMQARDRPAERWPNPSTNVHILVRHLRSLGEG
jgi:hypothetical protein